MKNVQQVRFATAAADAFVGAPGQLVIDTDLWNIRVHDGVTPGGHIVQNVSQYAANNFRDFSALATHSVPGAMPDTSVSKYNEFTVPGTYTLPALSAAGVGSPLILEALVTGVDILCPGTDVINELGTDVITISLNQYEVVRLAKHSASRWKILNRY